MDRRIVTNLGQAAGLARFSEDKFFHTPLFRMGSLSGPGIRFILAFGFGFGGVVPGNLLPCLSGLAGPHWWLHCLGELLDLRNLSRACRLPRGKSEYHVRITT